MNLIIQKPDTYGALASSLCLVHCIATPFLLVSASYATAPVWWTHLDAIFLTVSFFALYRSVQTTSRYFMKYTLWSSYGILCMLIVNEKMQWAEIPEFANYLAAIALVGLHLYNLKYCQCKSENCCVKTK